MSEEKELFKTTLMGGYDKEDVLQELEKIKGDSYAEKKKMTDELEETRKLLAEKTSQVETLEEIVRQKELEVLLKDKEIKEKYQSYIDNYDTIGSLIFESKVRAKQIEREAEQKKALLLHEAEEEAAGIRREAEEEARRTIEEVQRKADEKAREGEARYEAVQEELNNIVDLVNRVQRMFMKSYKSIQKITSTVPDDTSDLDFEDELFLRGGRDELR